jgi:hypothetical protein
MTLAITPPAWYEHALCATVDPELFHPEKGGSNAAAKRICAGCDVLEQCRAYALEQPADQLHGIWGGTTAKDRRAIRAGLGLNVKPLQPCGTRAAYMRHLKDDEQPCDACARANFDYHRAREGRSSRPQTEHGTTRGYRQHRRLGTKTCKDCRAAWAAYCAREQEAS